MTAYYKRSKSRPVRECNIKDGQGQKPRPKQLDWKGAGFVRTGWNSHSYTWQDDFPVFSVRPGQLDQECGLVSKCDDVAKVWAYGTEPATIKEWIDEQILKTMRHDAEIVEAPIDWDEFEKAMSADGWGEMVRDF